MQPVSGGAKYSLGGRQTQRGQVLVLRLLPALHEQATNLRRVWRALRHTDRDHADPLSCLCAPEAATTADRTRVLYAVSGLRLRCVTSESDALRRLVVLPVPTSLRLLVLHGRRYFRTTLNKKHLSYALSVLIHVKCIIPVPHTDSSGGNETRQRGDDRFRLPGVRA